MTYREPLPEGCPPNAAEEIISERAVFRLVRNNPPMEDDFRSRRAEKPADQLNADECIARGLSVFSRREEAETARSKFSDLAGTLICQVALNRGAGYIQRTRSRHHYTWWPFADFDILANCRVVE